MSREALIESLNLAGRAAIVTGGSRGIGRAVVERLADAGVNILINYLRDETAAREAVKLAEKRGVAAFALQADLASPGDATRLAEAARERFGRIDILVCNAGIWEGAPVEEMSESLWDRVIDVNLKGTWTICRATVPVMKQARSGRVVIISSTAGQRGEANFSNYAASKGGQISFAKSLSTELAAYGITVNALAPGWVETEMTAEVLGRAESKTKIAEAIPLGRIAGADDIALPVLFLCSDWARHITGEVLNVNGGAVLCG